MGTREKSNLYPNATWEDCFEFAKTIAGFNLKSVSYTEVAKKYGLTSTTTKSFTAKISSSKQFGFITTSSGAIQLTELAKNMIYPTGDITLMKVESFAMPPLYQKLISAYDGKALPPRDIFENILMGSYKIAKAVKANAAKCFFESADQLDLVKGGIFCYSEVKNGLTNDNPSDEPVSEKEAPIVSESTENSDAIQQQLETPLPVPESAADYISQNIPVASGKVAKIIIPVDSTEDDLLLIKDMFDVLLKRKFKIKIDN